MDNIIKLGGREFEITAFTFDQLVKLTKSMTGLKLPLADGGLEAAMNIVRAALSDQLKADELACLKVTVSEILSAIPVIAQVSGLVSVGEAVAEMMTLTGTASMPASPPQPDGTLGASAS